jgi:hypothetical protein
MNTKQINNLQYRRYIVAFILTALIFFTGFLTSQMLTVKKLENLKNVEDTISLKLLSSETEYDLLKEVSCENRNSNFLTTEINDLAHQLEILEEQNIDKTKIEDVKKRYSLLLVKDYLLSKRINESCGFKSTFVIYFYQNKDICPDCVKAGIALDSLRNEYDKLKVYAFDYDLDLPIIKAMASVYGVEKNLPALVVNKKTYYKLNTVDDIKKLLPKEITDKSTASTTISTTTKK